MTAFSFVFSSPAADVAPVLAPFYVLHPFVATNETVHYLGVARPAGSEATDDVCQ